MDINVIYSLYHITFTFIICQIGETTIPCTAMLQRHELDLIELMGYIGWSAGQVSPVLDTSVYCGTHSPLTHSIHQVINKSVNCSTSNYWHIQTSFPVNHIRNSEVIFIRSQYEIKGAERCVIVYWLSRTPVHLDSHIPGVNNWCLPLAMVQLHELHILWSEEAMKSGYRL